MMVDELVMISSGICEYSDYARLFFFFQAEDGIRDLTVTGVQTCALPIFFRGHDVGVDGVQGGDRRIQSVRFPRTSGPGDQHHSVGLQDVPLEFLEGSRLEDRKSVV